MPVTTKTTWILVADGAKARILERTAPGGPLASATGQCLAETEARLPTREIGTERPGRVHESADVMRHAMAPRVDWRRFAKAHFAKTVAGALEKAALDGKYQALILIAPPQALGDLREALGPHARALVAGEISKDLTNLPDHELPAYLD